MANYEMMIYYISTVDKDIKVLQEKPSTKAIVKQLVELQEFTRGAWAKIHSIVKSMTDDDKDADKNFSKSQEVILLCIDMNVKVNRFYDKLLELCIAKQQKGNDFFINYLLEEMFFNYSIFLDALHRLGIYYIVASSFPFALCDMFIQRKLSLLIDKLDEDDENTP